MVPVIFCQSMLVLDGNSGISALLGCLISFSGVHGGVYFGSPGAFGQYGGVLFWGVYSLRRVCYCRQLPYVLTWHQAGCETTCCWQRLHGQLFPSPPPPARGGRQVQRGRHTVRLRHVLHPGGPRRPQRAERLRSHLEIWRRIKMSFMQTILCAGCWV